MAVGYNLTHLQVAAKQAVPTYIDVPGAMSWEPAITADTEEIRADGAVYTTAYSAPSGEGDLTFIDMKSNVVVVINGGVVSTSGTAPNTITRYEQQGTYVPPAFIIADWVPNIDRGHDPNVAGMRTSVPNATSAPVTRTSGQETAFEWTAATRFTAASTTAPMIIYEWLETAPTFTGGVIPGPTL